MNPYVYPLLAAVWAQTIMGLFMFLASLFLILLVLVQRGRGGGLAGAFGGMGGQSAFGTKAGDTFTRITIVAATVWILLCMVATGFLANNGGSDSVFTQSGAAATDQLLQDLSESDAALSDGQTSPGGDAGTAAEKPPATDAAQPSETPQPETASQTDFEQ